MRGWMRWPLRCRALKALRITDGTSGSRERRRRLTPARRADGPSACPGGSPHEPGTCRQKRQFLGTCSKPRNPFACGTRALSRFRGCLFCRVPKAHGSHVLAHGAAGAVKRPVVPHAPSGGLRNRTTGAPWGRTKHGAMTCVRTPVARMSVAQSGTCRDAAPGFRCAPSGLRRCAGCLTIEYD